MTSYMNQAITAVKSGDYIIRADDNGKAYNGFEWRQKGRWTTAPDWDKTPTCGNGLHGQGPEAGGFMGDGNRLVFCKTKGQRVKVGSDKIKVKSAMILLINELPPGLKFESDLNISYTDIKKLPDNLSVGGYLDLEGTQITSLPDNLSVGGYLDLRGTQITSLPDNLSVGGSLYLEGTQITKKRVPKHLKEKVVIQ
jgi:hypothetical protein